MQSFPFYQHQFPTALTKNLHQNLKEEFKLSILISYSELLQGTLQVYALLLPDILTIL